MTQQVASPGSHMDLIGRSHFNMIFYSQVGSMNDNIRRSFADYIEEEISKIDINKKLNTCKEYKISKMKGP